MINEIVRESGNTVDVLLRINTGIDAHTHEYIKTAKMIQNLVTQYTMKQFMI